MVESNQAVEICREQGVVARREHPRLIGAIEFALRTERLVAVLPGVYARPTDAGTFEIKVAAAARRFRDGVLQGTTAARMTFWPELTDDTVRVAGVHTTMRRRGFAFERAQVEPAWVFICRGVRMTHPALTAVDLADETDGASLDRVLRARAATPAMLHDAFRAHPHRRGNVARSRWVGDSADGAWSLAERIAHRLLREAGIDGWRANHDVWINGRRYVPDIAFPRERGYIEVDGKAFHIDRFEQDRARQNALTVAGWWVLRWTWEMLTTRPESLIAQLRTTLAR